MFEQRQVPDLKNVPQITGVGRGPRVRFVPAFVAGALANSTSASPPSVSVLHGTSGGGVNSGHRHHLDLQRHQFGHTASHRRFRRSSSATAHRSTRSHDECGQGRLLRRRRARFSPDICDGRRQARRSRRCLRFRGADVVNRERILPDSRVSPGRHSQVKVTRRTRAPARWRMMFDVRTQPPVPGMPSPPTLRRPSPQAPPDAAYCWAARVSASPVPCTVPGGPPQHLPRRPARAAMTFSRTVWPREIRYPTGSSCGRGSPTPAATPGSGVGAPVQVTWRIGTDSALRSVVASGTTTTGPERDFTVKIDATGLSRHPLLVRVRSHLRRDDAQVTDRCDSHRAPADADVSRVRFGVVSCANWEADTSARTATSAVATSARSCTSATTTTSTRPVSTRVKGTRSVSTHRETRPGRPRLPIRHAQYKTDTDLAALHRALPWICTWDDHESADNSWLGGAENHSPSEGSWAARKAAAERAYYEWMPVRPPADAGGLHLYRRLRFGNLLDLSMLDLRTYRDREVSVLSRKIDDKARSITGKAQLKWLTDGLTGSTATWRIVGNPVMITPVLLPPLDRATTGAITDVLGIPEGGIPTTPTSGTATPPTAHGCCAPSGTRRFPTWCSSPATSTRRGRAMSC